MNWILGIYHATTVKSELGLNLRLITDDDLAEMLPSSYQEANSFDSLLLASQAFDGTMDTIEEVKLAKDMLASTEQLNHKYAAGIQLPTIQTPSQIKKRYEHLISENDVVVQSKQKYSQFEFLKTDKKVSPTELGTAVHELMQSLDFTNVSRETLAHTLKKLAVRDEVKLKIDQAKIFSLFDTDFGKLLVAQFDNISREAPFSMLKTDDASGQQYVIRAIIDGFIKLDNKIILFDYKTDHFTDLAKIPEIKAQYQLQMSLYAESLASAFKVASVEKYLILLGGPDKVYIEQV